VLNAVVVNVLNSFNPPIIITSPLVVLLCGCP
jgi:hypothetical protein